VITTESRPDGKEFLVATSEKPQRRRRLDGEASRTRILDAATEIASERGYEGTSIALVSTKCGLPASSIYWHFKDKDDLIAAVIERSFAHVLSAWQMPDDGAERERLVTMVLQIGKALLDRPDFLRLGLMLALERRPVEPRARAMFIDVRAQMYSTLCATARGLFPELTDAHIHQLATYAIAGADGLFIAKEIGGDSIDILALFEMHAIALYDNAMRMVAESA
jgi:AcrR family transcriptional regulator